MWPGYTNHINIKELCLLFCLLILRKVFSVVLRGPTTFWGVLKFLKKSRRARAIGLPMRPAAAGRYLQTWVLNFLQGGKREEAFILPEEVLEGRITAEMLQRESSQSFWRGQQLQGWTTWQGSQSLCWGLKRGRFCNSSGAAGGWWILKMPGPWKELPLNLQNIWLKFTLKYNVSK